ncbi:MAG: transporter substrate-binding domain-containing protein [Gammaproteobacteria bacterium]|nr:transporter substrate-binding domain-containing protein [Gammaproteobacteria bacterium]MCF6362825.1 transporter substrate-binding domain-containing protein [Gammaproteobacteria bacterium]
MRALRLLYRITLLGILALSTMPLQAAHPLQIASGVREPHSTPAQTGFIDRLVIEAFRRTGHEVEIVQLPAQRALVESNSGIMDGDLMRVQEIPDTFTHLQRVPEKLIDFEFMVFTGHTSLTPRGWDSLKPYEIGIVAGWKILERRLQDSRALTRVGDTQQLMRLLTNERVDLVVSERWQGLQAIRDLKLKDVRMLEPPVKTREMFLMLHKRHAALLPELAKALRSMKQDGSYQRLYDETLGHLQPSFQQQMP